MNYIINLLKLTLLYIFVAVPLIIFNATISLLLAIASNLLKLTNNNKE